MSSKPAWTTLDPVRKTNKHKQRNKNTLKTKHVGHSNLHITSAQDRLCDGLRSAHGELIGCYELWYSVVTTLITQGGIHAIGTSVFTSQRALNFHKSSDSQC